MTPMIQTDLRAEVEELIHSGIDAGQPMQADWITHAVVERHPDLHGGDKDFYVTCAFGHVRNTVRQCLREWKGDGPNTPEQLKLPGYEHLQKAYLVDRENEQVIVPLPECTNGELMEKIGEYRRMADGCIKHADELERYRLQHFDS